MNKNKGVEFCWLGLMLLLCPPLITPLVVSATESSMQIIPDYFFTDIDSSENIFQNAIDELFDYYRFDIDTSGWCTSKINDGYDSDHQVEDTIRIFLVDKERDNSFVFPFKNYITSLFGPRGNFFHYGIDIKVGIGDSIRCALEGLVRIVQNDKDGYGKVIVVRHHNGLETIYGHLSKCLVKSNARVQAGEVIGLGGNSGRSSGSHLHFEMRYCGQPFDPLVFMNFESYTLKSDILSLTTQEFIYVNNIDKGLSHKVKKGETLSSIALRYCVSVKRLCTLNNITSATVIEAGRTIFVRKSVTAEKLVQAGK